MPRDLCKRQPHLSGLRCLSLQSPVEAGSDWARELTAIYFSAVTALTLLLGSGFSRGCSPNLPETLSPLLPRLRVLKLTYCAAPTAEMGGVFGRLGVAQHVCVAGCHGLGGSALAALAHLGSSLQSIDARRIGTVSSDTVPHHLAEPRIAHHCSLTEETALCQTRLTTMQCGSFAL